MKYPKCLYLARFELYNDNPSFYCGSDKWSYFRANAKYFTPLGIKRIFNKFVNDDNTGRYQYFVYSNMS